MMTLFKKKTADGESIEEKKELEERLYRLLVDENIDDFTSFVRKHGILKKHDEESYSIKLGLENSKALELVDQFKEKEDEFDSLNLPKVDGTTPMCLDTFIKKYNLNENNLILNRKEKVSLVESFLTKLIGFIEIFDGDKGRRYTDQFYLSYLLSRKFKCNAVRTIIRRLDKIPIGITYEIEILLYTKHLNPLMW